MKVVCDFLIKMCDIPFNQDMKIKVRDKGYQQIHETMKTKISVSECGKSSVPLLSILTTQKQIFRMQSGSLHKGDMVFAKTLDGTLGMLVVQVDHPLTMTTSF